MSGRKIKLQIGKYLLNLGWREPIAFKRHGRSWCLFFGVGSLGRWHWMRGFDWGRIR